MRIGGRWVVSELWTACGAADCAPLAAALHCACPKRHAGATRRASAPIKKRDKTDRTNGTYGSGVDGERYTETGRSCEDARHYTERWRAGDGVDGEMARIYAWVVRTPRSVMIRFTRTS